MNKSHTYFKLVLLLIALSLLLFIIQIFLFHSIRDTSFYFLQDMAFLPVQVAIVSLVLNRFISDREKQDRLKKMNMAITAFFEEAGTELIEEIDPFVVKPEDIGKGLDIDGKWTDKDFQMAIRHITAFPLRTDSRNGDLSALKDKLVGKRLFLLSMLGNSNLLEHDTFTEMLWAVFHIMDELVSRDSLTGLPDTDFDHLSLDIARAYRTLLVEWIHYVAHLRTDYPYLYSLAVRKNPFFTDRSVEVR